jgi:hypothetical protein
MKNMTTMQPISLDAISKLLPAPDANRLIDEAFELRWLVSECQIERHISIQITDQMLKATFPTNQINGRGRVWLERAREPISREDLHKFLCICVGISELGNLKIWVSNNAQEKLHQMSKSGFMALPCVELEPRYSSLILKSLRAFEGDAKQADMTAEDYLQSFIFNPKFNLIRS